MVLEATVLVLDNSEWMRNGDYVPSRFEAQADAVNVIFSAKTQSNPENTVAMMTMAGKSAEVLVTFTNSLGKILSAIKKIKLSGSTSLSTGLQVAQHRQNKNQRQRIVAFVGSPLEEDEKALVKLAKKLKKNNVAVDIVNYGEVDANTPKLEAFIEAINAQDNSHLVTIPPGSNIISDVLISTPIVAGDSGFQGGSSGFEFGVDPNMDPELALALRISMEEERARQESTSKADDTPVAAPSKPVQSSTDMDEDALLQQALAMSMGQEQAAAASGDQDIQMEDASEEAEIQRAIQMSLGSLPGVDPNDPRIKDAMKKKDKK